MAPAPEVNNGCYEEYGERWYSAWDDPIALLRAETKAKLPWVVEQAGNHGFGKGASLLDLGCGAGFLSNPLSQAGFLVTGLDLSPASLLTASRHDPTGRVRYVNGDARSLPFADGTFSVVTCMDLLEHVEEAVQVTAEAARVLKPGGLFLYHTFNRNLLAGLVVIRLVEWLVANTPKKLHVYHLFRKPAEVERLCRKAGLQPLEQCGLRPLLRTIPLKSLFTGAVPPSLEFQTCRWKGISFLGVARKPEESANLPH